MPLSTAQQDGRAITHVRFLARLSIWALSIFVSIIPARGNSFKYAFQGDLNSLDPYSINETFSLAMLGNVYEGLTRRDKSLKIAPALAERWEILEPTRWRFYLRKGVVFHDGSPFTADDVLFSLERVLAKGSDLKARLAAGITAAKIDDHVVDFILPSPNPILHAEWHGWYIMSKAWAERHSAVLPQPLALNVSGYAALQANGTGPFIVAAHQPGVKTIFRPNVNWWGKREHNLDEVVLQTIKSDATRVAALLSGEVDLIDPVAPHHAELVARRPNTQLLTGSELRTIFLNMDQARDELLYSNVRGKNPFKDVRVRKAFYQAIDIEAIHAKIMRHTSSPTALLISPLLFARSAELTRYSHDPGSARRLLTEAGYENGFELTMDCPNDRYVNDEEICKAVAAMLARINVRIRLNAMPKAQYFAKVGEGNAYDSSFNLLGWTASSFDSWNVLSNLAACRDAKSGVGRFNYGGYCNPNVDDLTRAILIEADEAKRNEMILEAFKILHRDVSHVPLHQQPLSWGASKRARVVQRADNAFMFYWARKE